MEGGKDGRMEGGNDGRRERWKEGTMEGWNDGTMEGICPQLTSGHNCDTMGERNKNAIRSNNENPSHHAACEIQLELS